MELIVKSLKGSYPVSGIESSTTVGELKRLLREQHDQAVPEPEEQRLVFRHEVLASPDTALQQLGITHGDQLVLLAARPTLKRPRAQIMPAADTAAIREAITDEARRLGIEHTLKEERPPAARRGLTLPPELLGASDEQLLQLLQQSLGGQLLSGLRLSTSQGSGAGGEAEQEEEGEIQVPEPPADRITQLTEMGFSEALARKALILHRSNVEHALEWLLEHADDPGAADPPTQEQLQQVYGRGRRARAAVRASIAGVSTEALLSQLTDMGFDAAAAQAVLSRVGPSLELAVQLLLGTAGPAFAGGAAAAAAAGGSDAAGTGAAAAVPGSAAVSSDGGRVSGGETSGTQGGSAAADMPAGRAADDDDEGSGTDEEDEDEDEFEDGDEEDEYDEDEDEDEYYDGDEDALYDLPIGGMQLANLGSADIEQLLQGANIQELALGNQLLMPGGMDTGLPGPQSSLLRLLDAPAFLQQLAAGMQQAAAEGEQQGGGVAAVQPPAEAQQQQQHQQTESQQHQQQHQQPPQQGGS